MLRFLAIAVVLLPIAAQAQEVPAAARMDLWCGTAFDLMTRDAPADANAGKIAAAQVYADGAHLLIQRAIPIFLESGYTDKALAEYRADLEAEVDRIVNGSARTAEDAAFSFQDCSALIGQ